MAYPSVVTVFSTKVNGNVIDASDVNNVQTDVTAIETFLGTENSVVGTLFYDVRGANSNGGGHVQTANKGGTGQTSYNKGDILVASSSSVLAKIAVGSDNQILQADSSQTAGLKWGAAAAQAKFGGTGTDGALSISSSVTTIDCSTSVLVTKDYSSINITGTGAVAFSNPHPNGTVVILKSQGNVTLNSSTASMIDVSNMGATSVAGVSGSGDASGNDGTDGHGIFLLTNKGLKSTAGAVGGGGSVVSGFNYQALNNYTKYSNIFVGASGASGMVHSGGAAVGPSGTGGNGGGALIIECAGAWNFTTANGISVGGKNGGNGTATNANTAAGGGGGGGGGMFLALYNTLTANSGTVIVAGGTGGNMAQQSSSAGYGGGGGGSFVNPGITGTTANANTKTGGDGGGGLSLIMQNNEWV